MSDKKKDVAEESQKAEHTPGDPLMCPVCGRGNWCTMGPQEGNVDGDDVEGPTVEERQRAAKRKVKTTASEEEPPKVFDLYVDGQHTERVVKNVAEDILDRGGPLDVDANVEYVFFNTKDGNTELFKHTEVLHAKVKERVESKPQPMDYWGKRRTPEDVSVGIWGRPDHLREFAVWLKTQTVTAEAIQRRGNVAFSAASELAERIIDVVGAATDEPEGWPMSALARRIGEPEGTEQIWSKAFPQEANGGSQNWTNIHGEWTSWSRLIVASTD